LSTRADGDSGCGRRHATGKSNAIAVNTIVIILLRIIAMADG
jgi:hypothetical protein